LLAIRTRCKTAIKKKILDEEKSAKEKWEKYKPTRYMTWETELQVVTKLIWQLRKRRSKWNKSQKRRRIIAAQTEELADVIAAYNHVESLWWIYDSYIWKEEANGRLEERMEVWDELWWEILEISNTTRMFRRRLDSITNYFVHRHTNGYAEWLNSRVQRLISMTRWFANRDYLYYRIVKMFN
jgi:transposase